jgi:hypothetical protein
MEKSGSLEPDGKAAAPHAEKAMAPRKKQIKIPNRTLEKFLPYIDIPLIFL